MRIAIITAMAEETLPIFKKLGNVVAQNTISGVAISQIEYDGDTIYLATSGVGEIKAALAVQLLVDLFDVEAVLNFGFVGALNKNLELCELVVPRRVVHYQFDVTGVDTDRVVGQYSGMSSNYFYLDETLIHNALANIGKQMKLVTVASGDVFVTKKRRQTPPCKRVRRGYLRDGTCRHRNCLREKQRSAFFRQGCQR